MEKRTQLYMVPMIGIGFTKERLEWGGVYSEHCNYQFLCFQYTIIKFCKI